MGLSAGGRCIEITSAPVGPRTLLGALQGRATRRRAPRELGCLSRRGRLRLAEARGGGADSPAGNNISTTSTAALLGLGGRGGAWPQVPLAVYAAPKQRAHQVYRSRRHIKARGLGHRDSGDEDDADELKLYDTEQAVLVTACLIGGFTGAGILVFSELIHNIQHLVWGGELKSGLTIWLRQTPTDETWRQLVLAPSIGGALVSLIRLSVGGFDPAPPSSEPGSRQSKLRNAAKPPAKSIAAAVTLGTGASLGPEGPSVEIGNAVGRALSSLFVKGKRNQGNLLAAGSAAGISAGFGAPISGVFFAVEAVLSKDTSSMKGRESGVAVASILLASVCANAVSDVNHGAVPLFAVPQVSADAAELPLYWILGALCGLLCTGFAYSSQVSSSAFNGLKERGVPVWSFPILGGLISGVVSMMYPEIRYQAFDNVDGLLQSGVTGVQLYAPALLIQIVIAKVLTTAICRSSGLVGGVYAPSIFLGAALGLAYGQGVVDASAGLVDVSPQQSYSLVAVAAVIAGNCRVPLTAILLLFELTHDYTILLPTLGAVGLSYWVSVALDPAASKAAAPISASSSSEEEEGSTTSSSSDPMDTTSFIGAMELEAQKVEDYMQSAAVVEEQTPLFEVLESMQFAQPACLLVKDDRTGKLAGILTVDSLEQVICNVEEDDDMWGDNTCSIHGVPARTVRDALETRASGGIDQGVVMSCTPKDSLADAIRLMESYGLRYLPVSDSLDQSPVGVLDRDTIRTRLKLSIIRNQVVGRMAKAESNNTQVRADGG